MYNKYTMKTKIRNYYRAKLSAVISASKGVITGKLVSATLGIPPHEASRLLYRWNLGGWINRIKHGVYVPIPIEADPNVYSIDDSWIVVSRIYSPGYIGGLTAVDHWDLSEQIYETLFFFTTNLVHKRDEKLGDISVKIKTITPGKLFGTKTIWRENNKIAVSDPTKTITDLLDDPRLAGGFRNLRDCYVEYQNSKHANIELLIEYGKRMNNKTIFKRLGFLNETLGIHKKLENRLLTFLSKGYSILDPTINCPKIVRKWIWRFRQGPSNLPLPFLTIFQFPIVKSPVKTVWVD